MPSAVTEEAPRSGPHVLRALGGQHEGLCAPEAVPVGLLGEGSDGPPRAARLWHVLYTQVRPARAPGSLQGRQAVPSPLPSRGCHRGCPEGVGLSWTRGGSVGPRLAEAGSEPEASPHLSPEPGPRLSAFSRGSSSPGVLLLQVQSPRGRRPPRVRRERASAASLAAPAPVAGTGPSLHSAPGVACSVPRASPTQSSSAASALGSGSRDRLCGGPPARATSAPSPLTGLRSATR